MKDDHCMDSSGCSWQRNKFCPRFSDHFSSSRFLHSNSILLILRDTFFLLKAPLTLNQERKALLSQLETEHHVANLVVRVTSDSIQRGDVGLPRTLLTPPHRALQKNTGGYLWLRPKQIFESKTLWSSQDTENNGHCTHTLIYLLFFWFFWKLPALCLSSFCHHFPLFSYYIHFR